jgi:hypothetical protein
MGFFAAQSVDYKQVADRLLRKWCLEYVPGEANPEGDDHE